MTDFTNNPQLKTLSGWKTIDLVEVDSFSQFLLLNGKAAINLKEDAPLPHNFATHDIQQSCSPNGTAYDHTVTFRLAARSRAYEAALVTLSHKRFVAILTDNNGDCFAAGCPEEPLHFSYSSQDNGESANSAAYTITLTCTSRHPLLMLNQ